MLLSPPPSPSLPSPPPHSTVYNTLRAIETYIVSDFHFTKKTVCLPPSGVSLPATHRPGFLCLLWSLVRIHLVLSRNGFHGCYFQCIIIHHEQKHCCSLPFAFCMTDVCQQNRLRQKSRAVKQVSRAGPGAAWHRLTVGADGCSGACTNASASRIYICPKVFSAGIGALRTCTVTSPHTTGRIMSVPAGSLLHDAHCERC